MNCSRSHPLSTDHGDENRPYGLLGRYSVYGVVVRTELPSPTPGSLEWTGGAPERRMILRLLQRHCGLWAPQGFFRALWWFRWGRLTIRWDNRRQGA